MNTKTTCIIFDLGGVLIGWDPHNLYRRYFDNPQEIDNFLTEIRFSEWNAQQDKGRPFSEAVKILSAQFPQYADLIRAYHEHWEESITGEIHGTVKILRALKEKGFPLYALSNWSDETYHIVSDRFDFLSLFDEIILSGRVKLIKPEPAIFELTLKQLGKSADECLFIDDSEPNIATANQLGFDTIRFTAPEQLQNELQARNILS